MKRLISITTVLVLALMIGSCTPKMKFATSSVVPAATGSVAVKKDKNNNYVVSVSVMNLAPPERLNPPQQVYVVWTELEQNSVKKLGLLKPASNTLKASLTAPAVSKPVRVFITAERDADIQYPAGAEVLTAR